MNQLTISNIVKEDNLVTELNLLELQQIKGGGGKVEPVRIFPPDKEPTRIYW